MQHLIEVGQKEQEKHITYLNLELDNLFSRKAICSLDWKIDGFIGLQFVPSIWHPEWIVKIEGTNCNPRERIV